MEATKTAVRGDREKIREILRLELEIATDHSLRGCDQSAANILKMLAGTTRDADPAVLLAYAELLDDISDSAMSSDALRQIGAGWFPADAAEYVKRLVSIRKASRRNP